MSFDERARKCYYAIRNCSAMTGSNDPRSLQELSDILNAAQPQTEEEFQQKNIFEYLRGHNPQSVDNMLRWNNRRSASHMILWASPLAIVRHFGISDRINLSFDGVTRCYTASVRRYAPQKHSPQRYSGERSGNYRDKQPSKGRRQFPKKNGDKSETKTSEPTRILKKDNSEPTLVPEKGIIREEFPALDSNVSWADME